MKILSIYIHIPFCEQKCFYCDFLSFEGKEKYFNVYIKALLKEIEEFALQNEKYIIKTIFIGGGTPSILDIGQIGIIMEKIYNMFNVCKNAEISIETNPNSICYEKIKHFKDSGINRLSIGLQAYQNNLLKKIGRIHTVEQFLKNYDIVRKVGFDNVNIDVMFSLPTQTKENFIETLQNVCKLNPEHLSVYSLILEEKTKFYDMYEKGEFELFDDDLDRELYELSISILDSYGYNLYEISNFAKKGFECRHNSVYWELDEYIGFGLGASSFINGKRFKNTTKFKDYIQFKNKVTIDVLTKDNMYSEFIFLGLRLTKGIKISKFKEKFNKNIFDIYSEEINFLIQNKLLAMTKDTIYLTRKGIDLSNFVFAKFV